VIVNSVVLDGNTVSGAIADLQGDGLGGSLSPALKQMRQPNPAHTVPTTLISGIYQDFADFESSLAAIYIRHLKCRNDALAQQFHRRGLARALSKPKQ
jgi:hypothetical protein